MSRRSVVRGIARRIPAHLKELRGKLMLEAISETLGVAEARCPACEGAGCLDGDALEYCPVCCGFEEVPDRLADWFKAQFRRTREGRRPGSHAALRARNHAIGIPSAGRCGRLAERPLRVHVPLET